MKKFLFSVLLLITASIQAADSDERMPEKAQICAACHGQKGLSLNPEWPNLAGQHASYLLKQLNNIKQGTTRSAPTMTAILANLTEADSVELATYYSKEPPAEGAASPNNLKRGEQLYRGGDFDKHITACIACHGPKGTGNAQAGFPVLSGQHTLYTLNQLQAFKDKRRSNDLNSIMRDLTARMSQDDMEAVANYIQGLQ